MTLRRTSIRSGWHRGASLLRAWGRCRRAASAVELSMLAPMLAAALLTTFDLGMGMTDRMAIDHVLRAGAQEAMDDAGVSAVKGALAAAAASQFSSTAEPTLTAERFCACPGAMDTPTSCSTPCGQSTPPFTYYRLRAQLVYTGTLWPAMTFDRTLQIQVR